VNLLRVREASFRDRYSIYDLIDSLHNVPLKSPEEISNFNKVLTEYIKNPNIKIFVAEENLLDSVEICGFLSLFIKPILFYSYNVCHIEDIVIKDEYKGKGVGAGLLETAINYGKRIKCKYITVSIEGGDPMTKRFYKACGFAENSLEMKYYL
jgi:GNAT superfamily N-acetyltransferase